MTDIDLDALEALAEAADQDWWWTFEPQEGRPDRAHISAGVRSMLEAFPPEVTRSLVARVREADKNALAKAQSEILFWREQKIEMQAERDDLRARLEAAERERDLLAQAMWDGLATLGFDTDGDNGPGAWIAGAKSYATFAGQWLRDIDQHRKDDDEGMDEDTALRDAITQLADEWAAVDMGTGLYPEDSAHREAHEARSQQCADDLRALIQSDTGGTNE